MGTERSFGLVFAGGFALLAVQPLLSGTEVRLWALGVALIFLIAALVRPSVLRPLNLIWFRIGLVLHRVVTPIVLFLIFYAAVTPVGWLMRATGKDPLRLKRSPSAASYWIERVPPGPSAASMKDQF